MGEGWASDHKPLYPSQIEAFSPCYMHTGHNLKWTVLATGSREHSRCAKVLQLDVWSEGSPYFKMNIAPIILFICVIIIQLIVVFSQETVPEVHLQLRLLLLLSFPSHTCLPAYWGHNRVKRLEWWARNKSARLYLISAFALVQNTKNSFPTQKKSSYNLLFEDGSCPGTQLWHNIHKRHKNT